jgi:hypothetical protein
MRFVVLFLTLCLSTEVVADGLTKIIIPLQVSGHTLTAEVVYTDTTRAQGLMYRDTLAESSGMLFVFPRVGRYSMWMLNTYIPLTVAYIDEKGFIFNILDMMSHTTTVHSSAGLAKYALEMNQGWFSENQIEVGEKVMGLEQAPAAE